MTDFAVRDLRKACGGRAWPPMGRPTRHDLTREPDPGALLELGAAYRGAKVLLSAVELDVFTVLAERQLDAASLAARIGIHSRGARDFFDALVALELLEREDGLYANSRAAARWLDRAKPASLTGLFDLVNGRLYDDWGRLTDALRTGRPQTGAGDIDTFASFYRDSDAQAVFLRGMTGLSRLPAVALAERFPWSRHQTVIDIGAAEGCVPVTLAQAHPHLTGGGFDLPQVRGAFEAYVAGHKLTERLRFYPGDFLHEPLPSADVLVMGHILHDWDLETKRMLVAKAHAALPAGGALIVYDAMIDELRRENLGALLMSLSMLIQTPGGFDYTGSDCIDWLREAGFTGVSLMPLQGIHSMAIGLKGDA
jgi:hypothetical protein